MTGGGTAHNLHTTKAKGLGEGWSDAMGECVSRPIWQRPLLTYNLTPLVGCFKPKLHLKMLTTLLMLLGNVMETGSILTRQIRACDINKSLPLSYATKGKKILLNMRMSKE